MSLLSKISALVGRASGKRKRELCDWMIENLNGLTADQIAAHVEACPVCGPTMKERRPEKIRHSGANINPGEIPTIMVIGIDGSFNLDQVLSLVH